MKQKWNNIQYCRIQLQGIVLIAYFYLYLMLYIVCIVYISSVFNALYRLLTQFLYNHLYLTVDKNLKVQPFR